jgi:hypothetical protein
MDVDHDRLSRPQDLDLSIFLLGIEPNECLFFLPIVECCDQNHDDDSNDDCAALYPVDWSW